MRYEEERQNKENSYCGYSVLKVYHNNMSRGMFFDKLNIFNNIKDLNQYLQCCKYVFNQSKIASERWNGNIDFTFYICDIMLNSSFINSTYNGCGAPSIPNIHSNYFLKD